MGAGNQAEDLNAKLNRWEKYAKTNGQIKAEVEAAREQYNLVMRTLEGQQNDAINRILNRLEDLRKRKQGDKQRKKELPIEMKGLSSRETHLNKLMAELEQKIIAVQEKLGDACFVAGTPLLTPTGSKPIEQFQVGDEVLTRSEFDPDAPVVVQVVEKVFVTTGRVLNLHIGGQVIGTTSEHPFFVINKGWTPAGALKPGDQIASHDGQDGVVEEVFDTGEVQAVYNIRVAECHTYFVGCSGWGLTVWSHNACLILYRYVKVYYPNRNRKMCLSQSPKS